ncbi:MAG: ScyD/ScyE family protein [Janthinobacterium lividum]
MLVRNRVALLAATALTCAGLVGGAPATAGTPKGAAEKPATVTVVATGLEGPRQLSQKDGYFYVAESDAARVTRIRRSDGRKRVVVTNIPTAQGVTKVGGKLYMASGESEPDGTDPGAAVGSKLYVAKPFHRRKTFADPYAFELKYNPDNQTLFDDKGVPLDAVSNPYFVIERKGPGLLLMAAAGGNDVLAVSRKGKLSTFFVPPVVTTGVCATAENNTPAGPSCDPVPTGIAYGPDGNLYISGLSGLAPGEARVYVVDRNGRLLKTLTGFSNAVGVAVGPDGSVYVSDLLQGAPSDEASASRSAASPARAARTLAKAAAAAPFDPATIGQIVKVAPDGKRTYAQVTMPSGLLYTGGKLYASTWAIAGELGAAGAGQVVSVDPSSFVAQ